MSDRCAAGCGFYGSSEFNGMCSRCHRVAAALAGQRIELESVVEVAGTRFVVAEVKPWVVAQVTTETTIKLEEPVAPWEAIRVMAFDDTCPRERSTLFDKYVAPFFRARPGALVGEGYEFARDKIRFRVVGVRPESQRRVRKVVSASTEIVVARETLPRRPLLQHVRLVPYQETVDQFPEVDGTREAVMSAFLLEKSLTIQPEDDIHWCGTRWRVIATDPEEGGGATENTMLHTDGFPVESCRKCSRISAYTCEEPGCGIPLCVTHHTKMDGEPRCIDHGPSACSTM
eukprot:CAMPEP_0204330590 /NCGR_PEP_ID=MMETSP0469-20131031/15038_1 /ASSEMBLY_ACC=CAM_ASM_000384 /TAXON_ID=2969 /ORGANISM="Oxyrrhis marina" /LENGTH=286 /DNA_ID=CAMNT_0051313419 /DNA_START=35 /DNA_END=895 /DNA_ORIENTATION=+